MCNQQLWMGILKYPYLLIKEHRFTELVVIYSHELDLHNGLREALTQLRSEYWVVKARNFIKKVLRNCIICRKHEGQSYKYPPETPLPRDCVTCEQFIVVSITLGLYLLKIFVEVAISCVNHGFHLLHVLVAEQYI